MTDFRLLKTTIASLKESGNIDKVILIGSWCEIFYQDIFTDYISSVKTKDNDYLIDKRMLSGDKSTGKAFLQKMGENGYLYNEDPLSSKTKLISIERGEEIEFLVPLDRKNKNVEHITDLNVNAEVLTHLEILRDNTMQVDYEDTKIRIPVPEAYVLQKLIINNRRTEDKSQKDIETVKRILPEIQKDEEHYKKLISIFESCSKKERKAIIETCDKHGIILKDREYKTVNNVEYPIYCKEYTNEMYRDEKERYSKYIERIEDGTVSQKDRAEIDIIISKCRNDFLLKDYQRYEYKKY